MQENVAIVILFYEFRCTGAQYLTVVANDWLIVADICYSTTASKEKKFCQEIFFDPRSKLTRACRMTWFCFQFDIAALVVGKKESSLPRGLCKRDTSAARPLYLPR